MQSSHGACISTTSPSSTMQVIHTIMLCCCCCRCARVRPAAAAVAAACSSLSTAAAAVRPKQLAAGCCCCCCQVPHAVTQRSSHCSRLLGFFCLCSCGVGAVSCASGILCRHHVCSWDHTSGGLPAGACSSRVSRHGAPGQRGNKQVAVTVQVSSSTSRSRRQHQFKPTPGESALWHTSEPHVLQTPLYSHLAILRDCVTFVLLAASTKSSPDLTAVVKHACPLRTACLIWIPVMV